MEVDLQEFVGSEVFWGALAVIIALAGSVGSALTFGMTAWIRHRERPSADWAVNMWGHSEYGNRYGDDDGFSLTGFISNAGDGDAFRVRLEAREGSARLVAPRTDGRIALVQPGDEVKFSIHLPLDRWETSSIDLVWTEPPTRLQKETRIPLDPRLHMERPEVTEEVTDPETGDVSRVVVDPVTLA